MLLWTTNELDDATRILINSKLKGKAFNWYHSRMEFQMSTDELLAAMASMFDQRKTGA